MHVKLIFVNYIFSLFIFIKLDFFFRQFSSAIKWIFAMKINVELTLGLHEVKTLIGKIMYIQFSKLTYCRKLIKSKLDKLKLSIKRTHCLDFDCFWMLGKILFYYFIFKGWYFSKILAIHFYKSEGCFLYPGRTRARHTGCVIIF